MGLPTVCSETCVGRLRYLGVMLYDADKVLEVATTPDPRDLYEAQLGAFLDPEDPAARAACEQAGIAHDWIEAARRSPVYALISRFRRPSPTRSGSTNPRWTAPAAWTTRAARGRAAARSARARGSG
ncbi:MAG TPA: hypothetical protein VFN97_14755 [Actinospica sp.]|nr:hypothetical protein [Actinospica sp.]